MVTVQQGNKGIHSLMQEAFLHNRRNFFGKHISGISNLALENKVGFLVKILGFSQQKEEVEGRVFKRDINRCKVLR